MKDLVNIEKIKMLLRVIYFKNLKNNTLLKPTHRSSNTFDNLGNALVSLLALSSKNSWVDIMY